MRNRLGILTALVLNLAIAGSAFASTGKPAKNQTPAKTTMTKMAKTKKAKKHHKSKVAKVAKKTANNGTMMKSSKK